MAVGLQVYTLRTELERRGLLTHAHTSTSFGVSPCTIPCASRADHTTPPLPPDSVPVAHAAQFALVALVALVAVVVVLVLVVVVVDVALI